MAQHISKLAGAIACTVIGVANLQLPVYAATITYDFTIKLTPPDPDTLPPGFSEFYNGFFSYDTDAAIALTPSGDLVYYLTDFSFDFFAPPTSFPPTLTPRTYTLADLRPQSFVIGTVASGTPPVPGSPPGGLFFSFNFSEEFVELQGILSGNLNPVGFIPGGFVNTFDFVETNVDGIGGPILIDPDIPTPIGPTEFRQKIGEFVSVTLREGEPPIPPTSIPEPTSIAALSVFGLGLLVKRKSPTSQMK